MKKFPIKLLTIACATCLALPVVNAHTFVGDSVYSNTGWNGTHGGPHNDDYSDIDLPRVFKQKWSAIPNNAFVQASNLAPDGKTIMTTSAFGANTGKSNFVVLDPETGKTLWQLPPWTNTDDQFLPDVNDPNRYNKGFDSCAGVNTSIIDEDGNIFISDCNQLWALNSDGSVKWAQELPDVPEASFCSDVDEVPFQNTSAGKVNPLVVPVFSKDGSVGGITSYGDIVFYDRETGKPTYEPFRIQADIGCNAVSDEDVGFNGLVDDELRTFYLSWIVADDAVVSADTPAVAVATTGRMFASAKGANKTNKLWAFDLKEPQDGKLGQISVAWQQDLDLQGGSSPALNIEETMVSAGAVVAPDNGNIKAFSTDDGHQIWSHFEAQGAAGSVATTPDGTVYAIPFNGLAIDVQGVKLWGGEDQPHILDELKYSIPEHPDYPRLVGASSIIVLTKSAVVHSVNVGYVIGTSFVPVKNYIITRDLKTGELIKGSEPFSGPTSLENIMTPNSDGTITLAYGSLLVSKFTDEERAYFDQKLTVVNQKMLPSIGGLVQIEGVDEITLGEDGKYLDGAINSGDFKIQDNSQKPSGNAELITITKQGEFVSHIDFNIEHNQNGYTGAIQLDNENYKLHLDIDQETIKSDLGKHAISGSSDGYLIDKSGKKECLHAVPWQIKDWS